MSYEGVEQGGILGSGYVGALTRLFNSPSQLGTEY